MSPKGISIVFTIVGVCWVGGWGYLMFRYPEFFAKINARFGFRMFASPKFIAFTRWMGIVEMTLAGLSVISALVMSALGLKWY
jgi:hypothetical protein